VQKRSLSIAGHRTSIALEPEFWDGLEVLAQAQGLPLSGLIRQIDEGRSNPNLSSALRLAVLGYFRRQAERGTTGSDPESPG
jgi:predicted DNA-binding ribbon-helix-helix protein